MKAGLVVAVMIAGTAGAVAIGLPSEAQARSKPLHNPALLNIGFVCRWDRRCIRNQQKAMARSLKHVRKYPPAAWRVQLCNRNSSRDGTRKDWVGFENCLRNADLRPPAKSRRKAT